MAFVFDSGYLFGVNPSGQSVRFGSMQGVAVDEHYVLNRIKLPLQAAQRYAVASLELDFEAKVANLSGAIASTLFLGQAPSSGSNAVARDYLAPVPASGPYAVTPTVPNSGTWGQDLGVQYSSNGLYLVPVASSPTQGQYTVSAGVYTFNSADASAALTINFLYGQSTGNSLVLSNPWQGVAPSFSVVLNTLYNGTQITWQLNACVSSKLALLTKVNDFSVPAFSFKALADLSNPVKGVIGTFSYSD